MPGFMDIPRRTELIYHGGKKMNRLKNKKWLTVLVICIFVIGLIPICYLSGFVHATGDDYHYGAMAHWAWQDTHSLWKTLQASMQNTRSFWHGWQGTWFTVFLMGLQPEVFSPYAYWIVPFIMIGLNVLCTSLLTRYCFVKKLGLKNSAWAVINFTVLFAVIQFFPSTKSGIFWWNGTVHYIIPYCLAVIAILCFMKYIDCYRVRYWTGAFLCMAALGGCSYLAALLAPVILLALLCLYGRSRKKAFWLLIPLAVEMVGLAVSMLSPGNAIRGGEEFGFSAAKAVQTVIASFAEGFRTIGVYAKEKPFVWLMLVFLSLFVWYAWKECEKTHVSFRLPGMFVLFMFCVWCAMFAPGIYAGVEVSGGVPNTIFQVFLLTVTADIVYMLGWLRWKRNSRSAMKDSGKRLKKIILIMLAAGCIFIAGINRGTLKQTTFYKCVAFIKSGQADDYRMQMEERLAVLLDDSQKDIRLPEMNAEQGPFMHMEIMEDSTAWTNTVMCEFYRKDRVVRIGR